MYLLSASSSPSLPRTSEQLMGSLRFQLSQIVFPQKPEIPKPKIKFSSVITCGLRNTNREPLWRSRVLSTEAIQAVQSLKLAKSPDKLEQVFCSRITRLLKADMLDTLTELNRQNELDLAFKVFQFLRKEVLYEPDISLFSNMIMKFGKNKQINKVEELFSELKKEGLKPDTRAYTELIGAYLQVGMVEKAMETYESMKASGCSPDKLTLSILIKNLQSAGEEDLVATVKKDTYKYLDYPKKFLREVETKFPKRRSLNLV